MLHRETKFIIGFDFAVPLSSFRTIGRTEMADVEQTQKMIPFITCHVSFHQYFGVDVFDLDVGVHRTTNQKQLCGFWKHVSLSGFFPLQSLLRCLQTHTNKAS